MSRVFRLNGTRSRDPEVGDWLTRHTDAVGRPAAQWFQTLRELGDDVREVLHDGHPTACVEDVAFAYVDAFRAHANLGFFCGAELPDPAGLLQGTGKFMRHVKLRPGDPLDQDAVRALLRAAYALAKRQTREG